MYIIPKTIITVAVVLMLFALILTGCGVLSTLQVIVEATSAAVPILEAAGVPIPPQLPIYVAAVADCIGNANVNNPTTGELVTIAGCLASQVEPSLPPGTPQAIANIIAAIARDVANFLQQNDIQALKKLNAQTGQHEYKPMSAREVKKLAALKAKAHATAVAARALVKK